MTYTEEELNIEKYKLQCVIDAQQEELKKERAKYHGVLETCLQLKNEIKRANVYCDKLLHQKNSALQRLSKLEGARL